MLKGSISKAEYEALPEVLQEHYSEDGEGYSLEADGLAPKGKLDEFRTTNVEVMKERDALGAKVAEFEKMGGAAELKRLKAAEKEKSKEKLKTEDKFEEWKKTWEDESEAKDKLHQDEVGALNTRLERYEKTDKIRAAALTAGVNKEDVEDVIRLTDPNFKLVDGDIKVFDMDGAPYGGDPDHFFSKYYRGRKPKFYEGSKSGGTGADQDNIDPKKTTPAVDVIEIQKGDQDAINANLDGIATGTHVVVDSSA